MIIHVLVSFSLFIWDSAATFGLSNALHGKFADAFFQAATYSGNRENILLYSAVYTFFADTQAIRFQKQAIVGGIISSGVCALLKYAIGRARPEGVTTRWNSSFPSGHATMSSFIAVYFGERYPHYRVPLYLWAVAVGMSRVYLRRHWTSDVLAGYILGGLSAYFTIKFYDNRYN